MQPGISREDSTTAWSFATLTVITDHGKRDKALLTEPRGAGLERKTAASCGRIRETKADVRQKSIHAPSPVEDRRRHCAGVGNFRAADFARADRRRHQDRSPDAAHRLSQAARRIRRDG